MSCYTLCDCLFNKEDIDKVYLTDVLFVFSQRNNPYKVALDRSDRILSIYSKIAETNEMIAFWLQIMSMKPSSFETINIDVSDIANEDELFLKVCSSTSNQHKAISKSHERWRNYTYVSPQIIQFEEKQITMYDRDEALLELNNHRSIEINAQNSIIALDHSKIDRTRNE